MTLVTRDALICMDTMSKNTLSLKYLLHNFKDELRQKLYINKPPAKKWIETRLGEKYEIYKEAMDLKYPKEEKKDDFIFLCEEDCAY